MAIENIYSYLEYLALTVDQLADAVMEREEESAVYETRLKEMGEALIQAQKEIEKAEARAAVAETRAYNAEVKVQEMAVVAKTVKQHQQTHSVSHSQPKAIQEMQTDLFGAPVPVAQPAPAQAAPRASAPIPTKSNAVANDANALILAKKLDSTIDKVQRLIREARA